MPWEVKQHNKVMNNNYLSMDSVANNYWNVFFDIEEEDGCDCIENTILTQSVREWNQMGFQVVHPTVVEEEGSNTNVQYEVV